ncbi:MAG: PEP-CTERM sorting domain-containing protein [Phycisphaerae bacterium]
MSRKFTLSALAVLALSSVASAQFLGSGAGFAIPYNAPAGASSSIVVAPNFPISGVAVEVTFGVGHTWIGDLTMTLTAPNLTSTTLMKRAGVGVASSTVGDNANTLAGGVYRFTDRFGAQNFSALGGGVTNISLVGAGTPAGNWWSEAGISGAPAPLGDTTASTAYNMRVGDYIASGNTGSGTTYASLYVENNLLTSVGASPSNGTWTLNISDGASLDTGSITGWRLMLLPEPTTMSLLGLGALLIRRKR